ncbi:hypothetical protein [Gaopeijia maritima]|uniref:Uncharacterized protein n=1 Tax=Gaopeijia maritima TaxID=3119007 RepID=A0ABU9E9U0_9BACT
MSRAFVNEDAGGAPEPDYRLPDPESDYYEEAAAWALIQGADAGDSLGAEQATGYRWGDPLLADEVEKILGAAEEEGRSRVAQLARRYLRAAGRR